MTDQDYKTLETKAEKHTVKVRNYVTGADEEAIMDVTTAAMRTIVKGEGADAKSETEVDAGMTQKLNRLKVERFVIDIDGSEDNVVGRFFGMRREDCKIVYDFLNNLTKDVGADADTKKKS